VDYAGNDEAIRPGPGHEPRSLVRRPQPTAGGTYTRTIARGAYPIAGALRGLALLVELPTLVRSLRARAG
jgi:hypothetical protein